MHALILAAVYAIPFVPLSRAQKMDALVNRLQVPARYCSNLDDLTAEWLFAAVEQALAERKYLSANLRIRVEALRTRALEDIGRLRSSLGL
jgi:polysaccharide pyruvyl transferase WcaK-like protein